LIDHKADLADLAAARVALADLLLAVKAAATTTDD
jgi:hypothetical protein